RFRRRQGDPRNAEHPERHERLDEPVQSGAGHPQFDRQSAAAHTAAAERSAIGMLTYDLTGTEDAMTGVKGNVSAIVPYVQAVLDLSLGPQPIVIGGQQAGLWDPFAQTPGLVSSLQGIKQHCQDFHDNVLIGLANVPGFLVIFGATPHYPPYPLPTHPAHILSP